MSHESRTTCFSQTTCHESQATFLRRFRQCAILCRQNPIGNDGGGQGMSVRQVSEPAGIAAPIVIVGPTAVGKTDVAVELAERVNGEIVNADSMQVYIGMDIGTAKPDARTRRRVPFHLLDLVRPDQPFSVADWKSGAETALMEITARGHRAIVCGGTGMYVRALLDDWSLADTPADPAIRAELYQSARMLGASALHARLNEIDPVTAARLHPNDLVRIVRALEVYQLTGKPISEYQARDRVTRKQRQASLFGLTMPRNALAARIDARVDAMIAAGLEKEVRELLHQGYSASLGPMRSLGYKEILSYLQGEMEHPAMIGAIKQNTRRFAKRQMTWFRADSRIQWTDVTALSSAKIANLLVQVMECAMPSASAR